MNDPAALRWDRQNLLDLFDLEALEATSPQSWRFRSRLNQINAHGRIYGGQLLAQSLIAASRTVPADRAPTSMQFMFLQGASPDKPLDYAVEALQDGKRFSARHVRVAQAKFACEAQIAFAVTLSNAPSHMSPAPPDAHLAADPATQPGMADLSKSQIADVAAVLGYHFRENRTLDFRFPDAVDGVLPIMAEPRLRYWARARQRLPGDGALHAAAFAYLSDWWLNFVCCLGHIPDLMRDGRRIYMASLNHSIWFHRPLRADDWLLFDCISPSAAAGRGLAIGRVHDRQGRLVASVTQEAIMAPVEDPKAP